jgi:feruloyl esterase
VPWLKTVIANDPAASPIGFTLEKYRARIQELSALLDAQDPDLSAFRARGGKLLMKVNTTDYTANPRWSYDYYEKVVATMGQRAVDSFMRFYVAVGIFHNRNVGRNPLTNETVPNYVDVIAMLDDWVDGGKTPADTQIMRDMLTVPPFTVRASLPMCRYPKYPRYKGNGDPKDASSYACTAP